MRLDYHPLDINSVFTGLGGVDYYYYHYYYYCCCYCYQYDILIIIGVYNKV